MFNLTRQVICTGCGGLNFWKGDPKPADRLHCRYCDGFIVTYDNYIHDLVRNEAARILAEFMETDSKEELNKLRATLASQGKGSSPRERPRAGQTAI